MRPITFSCRQTLNLAPEEIARQILDLSRWPEFHGYGPLPGIKLAEFDVQTPGVVGTRIRVTNRDGSSHIEEIVEWEPSRRLRLQMHEFSSPVSRLATGFDETWKLVSQEGQTHVTRTLDLHAKSTLSWLALWGISWLLKGAIARHLTAMTGKPK